MSERFHSKDLLTTWEVGALFISATTFHPELENNVIPTVIIILHINAIRMVNSKFPKELRMSWWWSNPWIWNHSLGSTKVSKALFTITVESGFFGKRDNFLGDSSERSNWMYLRVGEPEVWSVSFSFFHITIRVSLSKLFAYSEALFSWLVKWGIWAKVSTSCKILWFSK